MPAAVVLPISTSVSTPASTPEAINTPLLRVGEEFDRQIRFTREQIVEFARISGDANPLHHDHRAAERASFGEIIASGQQTASQLMGLVATHFSRADDDIPREMLCLNFNFAFKLPVFAEQDITLLWRVSEISRATRRGGFIGHVDGRASVAGRVCVVGRGTVLVKRASTGEL